MNKIDMQDEINRLEKRIAELEGALDTERGALKIACEGEAKLMRDLRAVEDRSAELEGARAKAMEGEEPEFSGAFDSIQDVAEMGNVAVDDVLAVAAELDRRADVIAAQSAELADLREQCRGMEIRETAGNGIIIEQTATIDEQARELERLRIFVNLARIADDEPFMAETGEKLRKAFKWLDRAPTAQAEPPTTPCTGAEFVASAQAAIEPRSDEEVSEAIADLETR